MLSETLNNNISLSVYVSEWTLGVDITLMAQVVPKDYTAAAAAVSQLLAEAIYWTNFKTFGKHESFTHWNL